jgi:hypothetical protein
MAEALPVGSRIRVCWRRICLPGDLVTFGRGAGGVVTHRFVGYLPGWRGWRMLTRADGSAEPDWPVMLDRVVGRVSHVDGLPYRPSLRERIRACMDWWPATGRWFMARKASPASRN